MGVLRHNRYSVMAMLAAFVYDPLINWRLLVAPELEEARARRWHCSLAPPLGTAPWHRPFVGTAPWHRPVAPPHSAAP